MQEEIIKSIIAKRKDLKISQRELAKLTNINRTHVGKIEAMQLSPTLATLDKLLPALGLELIIREKQ